MEYLPRPVEFGESEHNTKKENPPSSVAFPTATLVKAIGARAENKVRIKLRQRLSPSCRTNLQLAASRQRVRAGMGQVYESHLKSNAGHQQNKKSMKGHGQKPGTRSTSLELGE